VECRGLLALLAFHKRAILQHWLGPLVELAWRRLLASARRRHFTALPRTQQEQPRLPESVSVRPHASRTRNKI